MIKISKKTRMTISGLLVGLASIVAVASYFNLDWAQMQQAVIFTLAGFVTIVLLAGLTVLLIKLPGILMRRLQADKPDQDSEQE